MRSRDEAERFLNDYDTGKGGEEARRQILEALSPSPVPVEELRAGKEACPVCGCTDWITTSLYGTECVHCLHKYGMPVNQKDIGAIADKYTPEITRLILMASKEECFKVRAILIKALQEAI